MTAKSKRNYNATRKLAKDLSGIVGISKRLVIHFTRILSLGYITQIASDALEKDDGKLKNAQVEIPYVGCMDIVIDNNDVNASIDLDDNFKKQILNAVQTGETSLITELEDALIKSIQEKYNALI